MSWFKRRSVPAPTPAPVKQGIREMAVISLGPEKYRELTPIAPAPKHGNPFAPAAPLKGSDATELAMDDAFSESLGVLDFHEGIGFLGYPFLAELSQRPEYRRMSETLAKEMTREWIELVSTGDDGGEESFADRAKDLRQQYREADPSDAATLEDIKAQWAALIAEQNDETNPKADKLKALNAEFKRLRVQDLFRRAAELDGFFGRGQIYIDTGKTEDREELKIPLSLDRRKVRRKALKRLKVVEPVWSYPQDYNASDPLHPNFYRPQVWNINGKNIHATRLLTFVSRELPDLLKPAYAFSGLSLSQMAKPYVDNWLRTRQSVSDITHAFSIPVLKTDLSTVLSGGDAEQLALRAELLNRCRDNRGLFIIGKGMQEGDTGEEFKIESAQLGGLDKLQAQAQEQMAAVCGIPLVKLLGITPSGLNASSDGEIRAFYDTVAALQEQVFAANLDRLLSIAQLSLFGEIDPEIAFEFCPLWQLDEAAQAASRKADADIDCEYVDRGVLNTKEVRKKLAADRSSPYASLDVDDVPEAPEDDGETEPPEAEAGSGRL